MLQTMLHHSNIICNIVKLVEPHSDVRLCAVEAGMPQALAQAIENADAAISVIEGTNR